MAVRDVSLFILYTSTGHVLLQHRTHDASRLPNYWAFFGGGIEQGESPTEALEREVLEELSYQVQNPSFLMAQKVKDGEDENTKYVFVEQYQDQLLQLGEGQAMGWFSPDETHELKMIEHDRAIVERMRDYLNQL
jgi:8-oxo-dGTP pyrophosphatase MutT (NUDIX family)